MPQRTNGGVFNDQILTGSLMHYSVKGANFAGAVDQFNRPVHDSAAEIIYTLVAQKATIVIMDPVSSEKGMSFALETSRADWDAARLQTAIRALGTIGVDNVDVSNVEVSPNAYNLLGGTNSLLELIDTPATYAGSANFHLVVNEDETGIEFVAGGDGSGSPVKTVFGRIGNVTSAPNDYVASQVGNDSTVTGDFVSDALDNLASDINISIQPGDNVSELVNDANYITDITNSSINDLTDVDTTGITTGQVLKWDGTTFLPADDNNDNTVTSVYGRVGDVVAEDLDYVYHQVGAEPIATGLATGGALSLLDATLSYTAGSGYIVDSTIYDDPQFVNVSFPAGSVTIDETPGATTWLYIDFTGVAQTQSSRPTNAEIKQNIYLGFVVANVDGHTVTETYEHVGSTSSDVNELMKLNTGVIDGGVIDLGLDKDFGLTDLTVYLPNVNRRNNPLDPNIKTFPGGNPLTFSYVTQTGLIVGSPVSQVDPETFNPSGDDLVPVENNSSETTIQYLYMLRDGTFLMQYGQFEYSSSTSGKRELENDMGSREVPSILEGAFLLYAFIMEEDTSVMTDTGDIFVVNLFNVVNDAPAVTTVFDRVGDIEAEVGDYEDFYANITHATAHEVGGTDLIDHDNLTNAQGFKSHATIDTEITDIQTNAVFDGDRLLGGTF